MQGTMLYSTLSGSRSQTYFIQYKYRIAGELDPAVLEESVRQLAKRHETLRTQFIYERVTEPLQAVTEEQTVEFVFDDISSLTDVRQQTVIEERKRQDREEGYLPSDPILMRIQLFRHAQDHFSLLWSFHHILMDAWCVPILSQELLHIYAALRKGESHRLPAAQPYSRYIEWLNQQPMERSYQYWEQLLEGYDQLASLPASFGAASSADDHDFEEGYRQQETQYRLDRETTARLQETAKACGVTLNTMFQAIWGILLQRYNDTRDVVFGAVVSGRPPEVGGIEEMIGLFINTIPVRVQSDESVRFDELIRHVHARLVTSLSHSYLPLYEIAAKYTAASGSRKLLDHILIFENYPVIQTQPQKGSGGKGLELDMRMEEEFEQADLDFQVVVVPGEEVGIVFRYNANKYDMGRMEQLKSHLAAVVQQVVMDPGIAVDDITLLTAEEQELLLRLDRRSQLKTTPGTLMHGFEAQAALHPHKPAVVCGEETLCYAELDRLAEHVAQSLQAGGVGRGDRVGCFVGRSPSLLAVLLGIWKAGAAYVPLDPEYPQERLRFMLQDNGAKLVLTDRVNAGHLPTDVAYRLVEDIVASQEPSGFVADGERQDQDLAYLIYTSGSTGLPKGVMVSSGNVRHFLASMADRLSLKNDCRILCSTSVSFDIFVLEALLPLWYGLTVVLASDEEQSRPELLNRLIVGQEADAIQTTPARLQRMLLAGGAAEAFARLTMVMVGGEPMPAELLQKLRSMTPARIFNLYGPTEATVWTTAAELTEGGQVHIGTPLDGTAVAVLNAAGKPQPSGVIGEVYIGGPFVAQGYWNRAELTAERFAMPQGMDGSRWYRTGDLGSVRPDGTLLLAGRADNQIKYMGHRVELGEIEACIGRYPAVRQACVLLQHSGGGQPMLRAFLEMDRAPDTKELEQFASASLPRHMVPGDWVQIEQFPLTPSGKLDRRALAELAAADPSAKPKAQPTDSPSELVELLTELWRKVLGLEEIGPDQNFFDLGGNSIHAAKLEISLESVGYEVELAVYEHGTINELAHHLRQLQLQTQD